MIYLLVFQYFEMSKKGDIELSSFTKEKLIDKIKTLECHVTQLQNVISKGNNEKSKGSKGQNEKKGRVFDFTKYNTRHVALKFLYLGWDHQGFAVQEDTIKTIEHELFEALVKTRLIESRETSNYHRCGRTDKGVSAFSQVISIDLRTNLLSGVGVKVREGGTAHERQGDKTQEIDYVHILNKVLPKELQVVAWAPVNTDFSARFSCLKRKYKYFFPRGNIDIDLMQTAGKKLVGQHDFRNLCKMDVANGVVKYIRHILSVNIECHTNGASGYEFCELSIEGNAFLWHQIRCIVAVLFLIGQGKEKPEVIDDLLNVEACPRRPQYTMASEIPLVLYDCEYEDVQWIYNQDCMRSTMSHMQEMWTMQMTKATIIKKMLESLESTAVPQKTEDGSTCGGSISVRDQVDCLIPGHKPRIYRKLLERQTCDSLEERIESVAKRRKLQPQSLTEEQDGSEAL